MLYLCGSADHLEQVYVFWRSAVPHGDLTLHRQWPHMSPKLCHTLDGDAACRERPHLSRNAALGLSHSTDANGDALFRQ